MDFLPKQSQSNDGLCSSYSAGSMESSLVIMDTLILNKYINSKNIHKNYVNYYLSKSHLLDLFSDNLDYNVFLIHVFKSQLKVVRYESSYKGSA